VPNAVTLGDPVGLLDGVLVLVAVFVAGAVIRPVTVVVCEGLLVTEDV